MSEDTSSTTFGANKKDVALAVAIGFMGLFGVIVILMLARADYTLTMSGTLDANLVWATFIGIIMSVMTWLGFKQGQKGS